MTKKGEALRLHPEKKQWPVVSGQRIGSKGHVGQALLLIYRLLVGGPLNRLP